LQLITVAIDTIPVCLYCVFQTHISSPFPTLHKALEQKEFPKNNHHKIPMQTTARHTLVTLVEDHLTVLIADAVTVGRHAKRARTVTNSNSNNNTTNGTPLDEVAAVSKGTSSSTGGGVTVRRRLHAADINLALQMRQSEKLYATALVPPDTVHPSSMSTTTTTDNPDHSLPASHRPVNLADFLRHAQLPFQQPAEVALHVSWLAVDGIAPEPHPHGVVGAWTDRHTPSPHPLAMPHENNNHNHHNPYQSTAPQAWLVQQLQAAMLSEELQLYFTRVTYALDNTTNTHSPTSARAQDRLLDRLAVDAHLQELVPFFARYVTQTLYASHVTHQRAAVRLVQAMLHNPTLHLELYLHELVPALLTAIVADHRDRTNQRTSVAVTATPHWRLRVEASVALRTVCRQFGPEYPTLQARVLRTLCQALGPDRSRPAVCGGLTAVTLFGPLAIQAFVLPMLPHAWNSWEEEAQSSATEEVQWETRQCQQAALGALGTWLRSYAPTAPQTLTAGPAEQVAATDVAHPLLADTWGDALVPLQGYGPDVPTDYTLCVL
jgi:transcription initiation factor TFIID subunit 6